MAGDDWMRPALCYEALRLGRVLAGLMPDEPEVQGLVALMEIQASRIPARLDPDGLPVPLPEEYRGRWDHLPIIHPCRSPGSRGLSARRSSGLWSPPPGSHGRAAFCELVAAPSRLAKSSRWGRRR